MTQEKEIYADFIFRRVLWRLSYFKSVAHQTIQIKKSYLIITPDSYRDRVISVAIA
jgi:hypothetical protein